jgi:hypothetical protein
LITSPNEVVPFLPVSRAKQLGSNHIWEPKTRILYDPVHDAQSTIQRQLRYLPGLTLDRRSVLETALSVIHLLSDNPRALVQENKPNHQGTGSSRIPPAEFLTWMLKGMSTLCYGLSRCPEEKLTLNPPQILKPIDSGHLLQIISGTLHQEH